MAVGDKVLLFLGSLWQVVSISTDARHAEVESSGSVHVKAAGHQMSHRRSAEGVKVVDCRADEKHEFTFRDDRFLSDITAGDCAQSKTSCEDRWCPTIYQKDNKACAVDLTRECGFDCSSRKATGNCAALPWKDCETACKATGVEGESCFAPCKWHSADEVCYAGGDLPLIDADATANYYYYGKQTTTTRIATTTTTVSTAPPMWLLANAQDTCDDLCKFNGYGGCGAGEIARINSTEAVAALLLQEFNITCNTNPNRNEDFGIFYADNDDCWFVDGTVDCTQGLSNVGRRPVCYCEGTTSTTTPDAGWAFGEDQDSCNDFCRFTGFDGCNESMIQEISTYPRAVRLIEGLGMNLTCDAAIRQKDTGVFINPSNVDPSFAQCFSVKGTVDCDVGFSSLKPLCFCSSTTVTTTLSVNWQLGAVGQTCDDVCTNGCVVAEMEQIFRMPRATRLIEGLFGKTCVQGGGSRSNGIFFDPTTGNDGKCFYFDPGAVNCGANDNPSKEAPVCYCAPARI